MKKHCLRYTAALLVAAIVTACSTTPQVHKEPARKATPQEIKEYREAEQAYRAHKNAIALKKFSIFIQKHPRTDLTGHAAYYAGQIYYDQADYFRAARYWIYIVNSQTISEFYDRAIYGAALAQTQLSHYDDALKILALFHPNDFTDHNLASRVYELSAKLKVQKGNPLSALQDLLIASDFKSQPVEQQPLMTKAFEVINQSLNQSQLEQGLSTSSLQRLELPMRYRLAQILYDQKSWGAAKDQFGAIANKFPGSDQAKQAQAYLGGLDAQEKTDSAAIGVVLPLTGKYAQMGYKTLRGIQMGLGIFGGPSSSLHLAIIDSEGNVDVARRGVERLVKEDHVVVVIGDILSKTATAVAAKAQELGVPCLALAQKQELGEIGDFVFRNTLTPEMQMKSLVETAMQEKGFKKFAILYPNDSYGTEYATSFWDNVLLKGGEITAVQSYQSDETDFRDSIQRLVGTYYAEEERGKELQLRLTAWQKEQAQNNVPRSQRDKPPKDILPPIVDFDALFIPDGPKAIGQIAPMLAYNDVNNIPLLGTNVWDSPQIVVRGAKFVENALFVDDYFNDSPTTEMKKFMAEFQGQFKYVPDIFEAQGYDSALLISQTIRNYGSGMTRTILKDKLMSASTNAGSRGPLRMSPQREVEKSLIPLTVQEGKIVKFETGRVAPR